MKDKTLFVLIFAGVFCFVGLVFAAIGFGILGHARRKRRRCTAEAVGEVTGLVRRISRSGGGSSSSWHAVYEYRANGYDVVKESAFGASSPRVCKGQEVTVYYNPDDPKESVVEEERGLIRLLGGLFAGIGCFFFAVGAVVGCAVQMFW